MLVKSFGSAVYGINATTITIEVNVTQGVNFYLVGLPDNAVKESQQRIESALKTNDYKMPGRKVIINMAPADIKKEGASYDLPLAIGILAASEQINHDLLEDFVIMGELSLDGYIKSVKGILPIAIQTRKEKFKGLIVPLANAREAAVVNDVDVYGVEHINEVIAILNGQSSAQPVIVDTRDEFYSGVDNFLVDFADVKGQENPNIIHI